MRGFPLFILIFFLSTPFTDPLSQGPGPSHTAPWVCSCHIPIPFLACHIVALCAPPTFSFQREKCCPNSSQFSPGMQLVWEAAGHPGLLCVQNMSVNARQNWSRSWRPLAWTSSLAALVLCPIFLPHPQCPLVHPPLPSGQLRLNSPTPIFY